MTVTKKSVQSIDLDDLERQLREVAVSSLPNKKTDDPLSELARIVGRERPLRSIVGGRAEPVQSVAQPVVANDVRPVEPRTTSRSTQGELELDPASAAQDSWTDEEVAEDSAPAAELAYDEDELHAAAEDAAAPH